MRDREQFRQPVQMTPATQAAATRAHADLAPGLPAALAALYRLTDGLQTDAGITVYPAAEIAERNATFEVARYAPGFVLFGDDSGGRGFLLSIEDSRSPVYSSDLGDLAPADFQVEAPDFPAWIGAL